MPVSFIPPALAVIADQRITTAEVNWFIQESVMIIIAAVLMAGFLKLSEEGMSW